MFENISLLYCWRLTLVCGFVASLSACSPSLNWREVRPPEAQGLELMFPCRPETQTRQVQLPGLKGDPVRLHMLTCEANGNTWALSYFDAGTPERWRDALAAWQTALQNNLHAVSTSKITKGPDQRMGLQPLQIPGATPHPDANTWWAKGERPVNLKETEPVGVRVWHFTKGLWVFQASVWSPALQPDDPQWTTFLNGIHFLP